MDIALLHPGDLSPGWLLLSLLLLFGVPTFLIIVVMCAVAKGSTKRGEFKTDHSEENRGTTAAGGGGSDRA